MFLASDVNIVNYRVSARVACRT